MVVIIKIFVIILIYVIFYVILQIALVNFMLSHQPKPNNREFKLIVNFTTCDYELCVVFSRSEKHMPFIYLHNNRFSFIFQIFIKK